jgi:hypothetical protein
MIHPFRDILQWTRIERARPPLRFTPARNQTRARQHLKVFGYGRHAHFKRLSQFGDRSLTGSQTRENGAPRGIGKGREGCAELIDRRRIKPVG